MQTASERARRRATESRLRAYYKPPTNENDFPRYDVWNLTKHVKYVVWWNRHRNAWECTCLANNLRHLCKHVARVRDREEKRVKEEALRDG